MSLDPTIDAGDTDLSALEPPLWPKVVGAVSLAWSLISLTCAGCGLVTPVITATFLPPEMMNPPPPFARLSPEMVLSAAMGAVVAIVLLAAGAATLGRKRAGRTLHLVYIVLALISIAVGVWVQFRVQAQIAQFVQQNPDHPMAQQMGAGGGMGQWFGVAFGVVIGLAYPVFCLVWFGFMGRKPDERIGEAESA